LEKTKLFGKFLSKARWWWS